MPNRRR